jgi:hypothetical protein
MSAKNIQQLSFTKIEIEIIKYLFKHYKDKYNARQIAKLLSLNHANVNKLCSSLAHKNLARKEALANSIFYSFNYDNKEAIKFIEYLISLEGIIYPKWLDVILYELKKFNDIIQLGCLFGSSIKNNKFNDIDVLLMYESKKAPEINKIKEELRKSGLIEKPIRYVEITDKDIKKNKDDKIFYSIISDCLVFHNPGKYVEVIQCLR